MSQASSVPPMSQPGSAPAAVQKQRSPGEKIVVWGGILLLLLLVAMQARARLGYTKTLQALQDRMAEDEGANANPLLVKDLPNFVFGWPAQKEEERGKHLKTITLTWNGLPMTKPLGLVVGFDPEEAGGTVMALETSGFVEPEKTVAPPPFSKEEAAKIGDNIPAGAAGHEPAADEPSPAARPAEEPAATTEPTATAEPAAAEPTTPTETKPAEQPAAQAPATETPATAEPATEQPADK